MKAKWWMCKKNYCPYIFDHSVDVCHLKKCRRIKFHRGDHDERG